MRISLKTGFSKSGFTIAELLITISIIGILAAIGISSYFGYYRNTVLKSSAEKLYSFIYETQQKAIGQQGGTAWGIHFENPAVGESFYASFTGDAYSSSTLQEIRYLGSSVAFSYPAPGSSFDIVFTKIRGCISDGMVPSACVSDGSFKKIYISLNDRNLTKAIFISPIGVVTSNDGIIGEWKMNEGSGVSVRDNSAFQKHGSFNGTGISWLSPSSCKEGNSCLSFSGNSYVDIGTALAHNIPGDMTVSAWVKWTAGGNPQGVISNDEYALAFGGSSSARRIFFMRRIIEDEMVGDSLGNHWSGVKNTSDLEDGVWYNVVGRRNGDVISIFINGVKEAENSSLAGHTPDNVPGGLTIGKWDSYSLQNGAIDDARIYDFALSDDEIKAIASSGN